MQWLIDAISAALAWVLDLVLWVPRKIFSMIVDGLLALFNAIPVPAWLSDPSSALSGAGAGVWYFLHLFGFAGAMTIVISAYGIRFLIRRIPVIG